MPFTAQELENAAVAALAFHRNTPKVDPQALQDKPLYKKMISKEKTFPGGKDEITGRVKGNYSTTIQGFSADDTVSYGNPTNLREWRMPWKLIHSGIKFTMHELLKSGISITDTVTGEKTSQATQAEKIQLANLLEDKIDDMEEGTQRGMNTMFWLNGSQDPELCPGLTYFVSDTPAADTNVAGLSQIANPWWRNRANLNINLGIGPETGAVLNTFQYEFRQLRRFGGRPDTILAGSDMMDRLEKELKAQGFYTQNGWAGKGRIDGSVSDLAFKNVDIEYDPTLDDLGWSKRAYVIDSRRIFPMVVDGEGGKDHAPARPQDQYAYYRARTWVGGLVCTQRNAHGVYAFV